jgi:hypothetical protein
LTAPLPVSMIFVVGITVTPLGKPIRFPNIVL